MLTVVRERAMVETNKRKTELNSGKEKFVPPVFGVWRSLVARFVRDEEAAGSSPATPTGERKQHGDARGCGCCHAGVCGGIGWCAGCVRVALGCLRQGALGVGE